MSEWLNKVFSGEVLMDWGNPDAGCTDHCRKNRFTPLAEGDKKE